VLAAALIILTGISRNANPLAARRRCTVVNKPEHLLLPILWPAFGLQVFNLSGAEIYLFSQIA
jgi:hypothetical protein